jgi:hypothetical protein
MESWWPRKFDPSKLLSLYGSLDANVLAATLKFGKPHEKAVALYLTGVQKDHRMAKSVARELGNSRPIVRYFAEDALVKMSGTPSPLDLHADQDSITKAAARWLRSWRLPAP